MAKCWSVTSLVGLVLLGYVVRTEVDAAPQGIGNTLIKNVGQNSNPFQPWGNFYGNRFGFPFFDGSSTQKPATKPHVSGTSSKQGPQLPKNPQTPKNPTPPPKQHHLSGDQFPKNPLVSQQQQSQVTISQPPTRIESCEVDSTLKIQCGAPNTNGADCEELGCCYDGHNCYYGKSVTVQCTKDGQFILVVAKDATLPSLNTETASLLGSGSECMCLDSNSGFSVFQFPVTSCGTVILEDAGHIVYTNKMISSYALEHGPRGTITRDSEFQVTFQCRYVGTSIEALLKVVDVLKLDNAPLPVAGMGPFGVAMSLGSGQCQTKGCDEMTVAFSSYYADTDYPLTKVLREPVYVDVYIIDKKDAAFDLTLDRCWATSNPHPHSVPQWDILVHGCPYTDDSYMSALIPVPSTLDYPTHHKRFLFKMFAFVEVTTKNPQHQQLYIHCTTAVCVPTPTRRCEPHCMRKKRDVSDVEQETDGPKVVVSSGQLIISSPDE